MDAIVGVEANRKAEGEPEIILLSPPYNGDVCLQRNKGMSVRYGSKKSAFF